MLFSSGVDDGGADAESCGVSGDGGSGSCAAAAAWSRMSSSRSDAGAVPADKSGGDDAVARTNRSTSDGRAFNRGRNPTCIQTACVTVALSTLVAKSACTIK